MKKPLTIPLFPLQKVLFPKMVLPLHIFEERYREMIAECREHNSVFGVLHHASVLPGAVGTTASIHKILHTYEDGRLDILALGEARFHLLREVPGRSFQQGEVEFFDDLHGGEAPRERIEELLKLYHRFISRLGLEREQRKDLESLVNTLADERELSYIIGQTIGLDTESQIDLLSEVTGLGRVTQLAGELRRHQQVHRIARRLFENDSFDPTMN